MPNDQMNALQAFQNTAVITPDDLDAALSAQREAGPLHPGNRGFKLLRIDQNEGVFNIGQENAILDPEGNWAANPLNVQQGFVSWGSDRKKAGEIMGPLGSPPVEPNNGLEWKRQISIQFTAISGSDQGEEIELRNSSNGALSLYDNFIMKLANRPSVKHSAPVGKLWVHTYYLESWKKNIHEPKFDIENWMDPMTGELFYDNDVVEQKETPAAPVQEQPADASPVVARARQRSRNSN